MEAGLGPRCLVICCGSVEILGSECQPRTASSSPPSSLGEDDSLFAQSSLFPHEIPPKPPGSLQGPARTNFQHITPLIADRVKESSRYASIRCNLHSPPRDPPHTTYTPPHQSINTHRPSHLLLIGQNLPARMSAEKPRNLRACLLCSVVLPFSEFHGKGCPNCETLLTLRLSNDNIMELTSQVFEGLITLHDPATSWVAKWQRLSEYKPGIYATKVVGRLPEDIVQGLEDQGVRYMPRDGSGAEAEIGA